MSITTQNIALNTQPNMMNTDKNSFSRTAHLDYFNYFLPNFLAYNLKKSAKSSINHIILNPVNSSNYNSKHGPD